MVDELCYKVDFKFYTDRNISIQMFYWKKLYPVTMPVTQGKNIAMILFLNHYVRIAGV